MKILQVIEAMIAQREKITSVVNIRMEYFFVFNEKYKWSINSNDDGDFFLHFYPKTNKTVNELASITNWNSFVGLVSYKSSDFVDANAYDLFLELYDIVKSKLYDLDSMFDDIIGEV